MENLDVNNEVIEKEENIERAIALIDKCQDDNNELIEYRNKLKKEMNNLKKAKYCLMLALAFTCFVKFPKVYNYDFLLNHITIILELIIFNFSISSYSDFDSLHVSRDLAF